MKRTFFILLKLFFCISIVILPFKILNPDMNVSDMQYDLSEWLLNPEINIDASNITYLITAFPSIDSALAISEKIEIAAPLIPKFENRNSSKRILLYNTHQTETYIDGTSIYEVTIEFAKMLQDAGFDVVFESSNFIEEAQRVGKEYHELYDISRKYVNEAFVNYGGFDLVIDVHRDACSRDVSYYSENNIDYAKLMFVVGMKSSNADSIWDSSVSYTDKLQQQVSGIMREPFQRASIYNQDMYENMLLLEVGGDQNTSKEALNSLEVFAKVLKEELQ